MSPPLLLVLDSSNIAARSYFAAAAGKEGQSVIGLARYNFKKMLATLMRECEPLRVVAALDEGKSFRHQLYPSYKDHRAEKDQEFADFLLEVADLLFSEIGAEVYAAPGYEADDVIATVADQALPYGWRTVICTNDADAMQLAHDNGDGSGTFCLRYDKGAYTSIGPRQVEEKFGIPPHKVALWKSLSGDPSDGIKGVTGVGPVAATRLAKKNASMKLIYRRAQEAQFDYVSGKDAALILKYPEPELLLLEHLTTLRRDAALIRKK